MDTETLSEEEINQLKESKTIDEWDKICNEIKEKRNGRHPSDWFQKVIKSGIVGKATVKFIKNVTQSISQ